jgi:hypothetical protein
VSAGTDIHPRTVLDDAQIILEGYMYKCSSGALTSRWQKRYFVLRRSKLVYFEKQSAATSLDGSEVPSVEFPMNRVTGVEPRMGREFDILIGRRQRRYQLKASSDEQFSTWVSALEHLVTEYRARARESTVAGSADSMVSEDGGTSKVGAGSSSMFTGSEATSMPTNNACGVFGKDFPIWEHGSEDKGVVSGDEVDALFSEWFLFLDDSRIEVKAGRMIDAGSRAVSDLWAVLGSLPRGEDTSFSEALPAIRTRMIPSHPMVIAQYIKRLCEKFTLWLQRAQPDDIPVLIEWSCRLHANLNEVAGDPTATWSTAWDLMVRRMSMEWEVGVIERLKQKMVEFWNSQANGWTKDFLELVTTTCMQRANWVIAYPTCVDILCSHAAEAMVASMNSCWRLVFKAKSDMYTDSKKGEKKLKALLKIRSGPPKTTMDTSLDQMIRFGNDCCLVADFCQEAPRDMALVVGEFRACMEGLSSAFVSTSREIAKCIVNMHFSKLKLLQVPFEPKHLAVRLKVPISDSLDCARGFIDEVNTMGVHETLGRAIVGHAMIAVANTYVDSLVKHRPRMSKFTRLAQVVAEDEGLFFAMFRELGRNTAEIHSAIDPISHIRTVLSEKIEYDNGNSTAVLVQHCAQLYSVFPSAERAHDVIKALLEVKGIPKVQRKDIIYAVSICARRGTVSPPSLLLEHSDSSISQS